MKAPSGAEAKRMAKNEKGKEESGTKEAVKEAPNAGFMDSM
jgi:hypothetical protein